MQQFDNIQDEFPRGGHLHTNKICLSHRMVYLEQFLSKTYKTTQLNFHLLGTHFLVEQPHQLVNRQHAILADGNEFLQPRDHEWTSNVFAEGRIPNQKHLNSCLS